MPSFYPTYLPSHVTYPLADYDAQSLQSQYVSFQEPPPAYGSRHHANSKDVSHIHPNPYDMYKRSSLHGGVGYGQRNGFSNSNNVQHPIAAPIVPPLRINNYNMRQGSGYTENQPVEQPSYTNQNCEEEKIVGGVSAKLDYDMDQMTDFVVQMTMGVINPPVYKLDTFRSWVVQVLNATRLPSATILLSLSYMTKRVRGLTASRSFNSSEYALYELLTVGLILGSKFLDDNTFQNKSWAEVSNIKVDVLNKEELSWLASFGHRLHHDPQCADGFSYWEERWTTHKAKLASASAANLPSDTVLGRQPSLRDTNVPHHRTQYPVSAMSTISLEPDVGQGHYATPAYSPYNSWFNQRSYADRSPSTAPHTGPNTPDYYSGHGGWGPIDTSSSRSRPYGYPTLPHFSSGLETYPPPYDPPAYNYPAANVWNCHGAACQCGSCRQAHMPRYGPIVVG